jgi:hypothetical protein
MTQPHLQRRGVTFERSLAAVVASLLLVAQCLAVAHYHPTQNTSIHSTRAANLDNGTLCALCFFHQHSNSVSSTTSFFSTRQIATYNDLYAAQSWPLYAFNSYLSGRSPP